jgi:hypothetical protein
MANGTEIRIAALRRTGQHAIIGWIAAQALLQDGDPDDRPPRSKGSMPTVTFLNDVKPAKNPFVTCTKANELLVLPKPQRLAKSEIERNAWRDWLLYNYEDCQLRGAFNRRFEDEHDHFVGRSEKRIDVIIVRDPFNFFASRLAYGRWMATQLRNPLRQAKILNLWKSYAREYLGETHFRRHHALGINYNRWCTDATYRAFVAKRLGLRFTDAGFQSVDYHYGGGSSFDGANMHGRAQHMHVQDRWKIYAADRLFRSFFEDAELVELSRRIFGDIPGMESARHAAPNRERRWRNKVRI